MDINWGNPPLGVPVLNDDPTQVINSTRSQPPSVSFGISRISYLEYKGLWFPFKAECSTEFKNSDETCVGNRYCIPLNHIMYLSMYAFQTINVFFTTCRCHHPAETLIDTRD